MPLLRPVAIEYKTQTTFPCQKITAFPVPPGTCYYLIGRDSVI